VKEKTRPGADRCFICGKECDDVMEVPGPSGTSVKVCKSHPGFSDPEDVAEDEEPA
jgi:hypothetical protein